MPGTDGRSTTKTLTTVVALAPSSSVTVTVTDRGPVGSSECEPVIVPASSSTVPVLTVPSLQSMVAVCVSPAPGSVKVARTSVNDAPWLTLRPVLAVSAGGALATVAVNYPASSRPSSSINVARTMKTPSSS